MCNSQHRLSAVQDREEYTCPWHSMSPAALATTNPEGEKMLSIVPAQPAMNTGPDFNHPVDQDTRTVMSVVMTRQTSTIFMHTQSSIILY